MAHDPSKNVVEVLPGIDITILAGLDKAHEQGRGPATPFASDKEPVLPTHRDGTYGILRQIVVRPEPSVLNVAAQGLALIEGIINRFAKRGSDGIVCRFNSSSFSKIPAGRGTACSCR